MGVTENGKVDITFFQFSLWIFTMLHIGVLPVNLALSDGHIVKLMTC